MSLKFISNSSLIINWFDTINLIQNDPGKKIIADKTKLVSPHYQELFSMWDNSNFNYKSIQWVNYYASNYGFDIEEKFANIVDATHIRSWISKIDPGYCAPWHWDIDDNEAEYLKQGDLKRYICTIGNNDPGHFSIVGTSSLHNSKNGDIFLWDNYKEWHAGMNAGLIPKYQYNFLGV